MNDGDRGSSRYSSHAELSLEKKTRSLLLTKPETRATLTEWPVNSKRTIVIIHRQITISNIYTHDHDKRR